MATTTGHSSLIVFICSTSSLFLTFQYNAWGSAEPGWFQDFSVSSDAHVLGKILQHEYRREHPELGAFDVLSVYLEGLNRDEIRETDYHFTHRLFSQRPPVPPDSTIRPYTSSFGLQGLMFLVLDSACARLGVPTESRFAVLRGFTSLLTAAAISTIIAWASTELGWFPALFAAGLLSLSPWLTVLGKSLYYVAFTLYLPLLACLVVSRRWAGERGFHGYLFAAALVSLFIKATCSYDFTSSVMIASTLPLFWTFGRTRCPWEHRLRALIAWGTGAMFGFLLALILHLYQLSLLSDRGWSVAYDTFRYLVLKRTHDFINTTGVPMESVYREGLESSTLAVVGSYFGGRTLLGLPFGVVIGVFALATILFGWLSRKLDDPEVKSKGRSLATCLWISFLAPVSWFVLAKGHSYVHHHLNFILWHVPVTIIGYLFLGFLFRTVWRILNLDRWTRRRHDRSSRFTVT